MAQHALVTVTITKSTTNPPVLKVDHDPALIDKENGITWQCAVPFVVTFYVDADDPFPDRVFHDNNPHSGVAKVRHDHNRHYKYMVSAFGLSLDPDVIIDT